MKSTATLVFDIGKTTKKALLFDNDFIVVEEITTSFPEIKDDDGFPAEDLATLTKWVLEMISRFTHQLKYTVTHINFSAYGASLVLLDKNGNVILPFYNYLKPLPSNIKEKFLKRFNDDGKLHLDTASPSLDLLNSALQLVLIKESKPNVFKNIASVLHLPQYFSYLISKKKFSDITSIGCHTLLWDYKKMTYHSWVQQEGFTKFFPEIKNPNHTIQTSVNNQTIVLGIGVHDSSAALMPYMMIMEEPFLLLSTGTWNICFNPFSQQSLTQRELDLDCLCYLTYGGKPVKASRIFLGHEHEVQCKALCDYFDTPYTMLGEMSFDEAIYKRLTTSNNEEQDFFPLSMTGTGPLPLPFNQKTNLSSFDDVTQAYHQLIRFLIRWQKLSISLVNPNESVKQIIIVGGFTRNKVFIETIKRELAGYTILLSDHPRASALGAAWLVHQDQTKINYKDILKVTKA